MEKNIEWLKEEIEEDIKSWGGGNPDYFRGASDAYENVKDWLNQLDEPETLSEEWISENVEYAYFDMLDGSGGLSSATAIIKPKKLQNLLVPKQEKVKIESVWAEDIEGAKASGMTLFEAMDWMAIDCDDEEKQDLFARAWLDGYEVEEEQKYILSINITDKASKTNYETFLNKRGIFHSMENESFNSEEFSWTEEEIKGLENGEILFEHFATKVGEEEK